MSLRNVLKITMISLPVAFLIGCSGGGGGGGETPASSSTLTGVLVDSAVSGVDYNCSSGAIGVTNTEGEFTCNIGDTVAFSLGGVALGSALAGSVITPATLFPNNPAAALNFAQLLQTFDSDPATDGISLEGVDLTDFITSMGGVENIDFSASDFDAVVSAALPAGTTLVSEADAQEHLNETFTTLGINPDGTKDETAPVFTSPTNFSVAENQTEVGTLITNDESAILTLAGTDAAAFTLTDGVLAFVTNPDFETKSSYSIMVIAKDSAENESTQIITVNITDVDETIPDTTAPIIIGGENRILSVLEGESVVTAITTNDSSSLLTLGGTDAAAFTLTDGVLVFSEAQDFETLPNTYSITIAATDTLGNESTQTITVNIDNVAETVPQITSFSIDVNENPSKDIIGKIGITSSGDTPIESILLSGEGSQDFRVTTTGDIFVGDGVSIDFETRALYSLSAVALNGAGESASVNVSISVNNLAEIVPILVEATASVSERSGVDTEIVQLSISEVGDSSILGMRLEGVGTENFDISIDGLISVSFMGSLDYETTPTYNLRAIATNSAGDSSGVAIVINIEDIDESTPTLSSGVLSVSEGISSGEVVGNITITSPESTGVDSISLSGDGADSFSVGADGVITLATAKTLDMRVKKEYELKAVAQNRYGASSEADINISLTMDEKKQLVVLTSYEHGSEPWISDGTPEGTYLPKDIHTQLNASFVENITEVNGKIFFTASTSVLGKELYISDGTEAGTTLVKDLTPGAASTSFKHLTKVGTDLYFTKDLGYYAGFELWKSDGTEVGTLLVKTFSEDTNYNKTEVESIYDFNGLAIMRIDESTYKTELWVSDGTEGGTTLLKDIYVDGHSYPMDFVHSSDTLYFRATSADKGSELWKSDGTPSGTMMVKDIYASGNASSTPQELVVVDDTLYFTAHTGIGHAIYKSDGSEINTTKVLEFDNVDKIINFKDELYVIGTEDSVASSVISLYKFNETDFDIVKALPLTADEIVVGADEFYIVSTSHADGIQIWTSDGTTDGTVLRETLLANSSVKVEYPMVVGDTLYFYSNSNAELDYALWSSTSTLTTEVTPVSKYDQSGAAIGTNFYYRDGELYRTNGVADTQEIVARINQSTSGSSTEEIIKLNNHYLFRANDGIHSDELWISDGTQSGTYMLKDIYEGDSPSNVRDIVVYGGKVYFSAEDGVHGRELWSSDGTPEGTTLVEDIRDGSGSSGVSDITAIGEKLYFTASNGTVYYALWRLDSEGVALVKNYEDREIDGIIELNAEVLIASYDNMGYYNIDKIDKNSGLVVSILADTTYYSMWQFNVLGDRLYFQVDDDHTGESLLLESDGTAGGTSAITYDGNEYIYTEDMFKTDSAVVVAYNDANYGTEVFKISGSTLALVEDVVAGSDDGYDDPLAVVGDNFYFVSKDRKLWVTNGDESGSQVIKDFSTIPGYFRYAGRVGEQFLFSFTDWETRTPTLYISDGTPEGTEVLQEHTR